MKYVIVINSQNIKALLHSYDKIVYFDSEEEANNFIDGCYLVIRKHEMEVVPLDESKINEELINYKDVHYM